MFMLHGTGVVSLTDPPVLSGHPPENNGPPPLTLRPEVQKKCFQSKYDKLLTNFLANIK